MKTYLIFVIQGFEHQSPEGQLADVCTLELIAKTEKEALAKARSIIVKEHYRVSNVIQRFENDVLK